MTLHHYINFNGNCKKAMEYYNEVFKGQLLFQTIAEAGMSKECMHLPEHFIMHSSIVTPSVMLFASDMSMPDKAITGNQVCIMVNCDNEQEVDNFFNHLSAHGEVMQAPAPAFWGSYFAAFCDQFGIRWMIQYLYPQNKG